MTTARFISTSPNDEGPTLLASRHYALLERWALERSGREGERGRDATKRIDDELLFVEESYADLLPTEVLDAFAAFRFAARQHLYSCGDLMGTSSAILGPLGADVVHDLKVRAALARRRVTGTSGAPVSDALASLYEAHAALGDALARAEDLGVLVVPGLPG